MDRKKLSDLKRDSNYKAEIILWFARKITVIMCTQKFSIHHKISHYQDKRYFTTAPKMNVDFIFLMNHCILGLWKLNEVLYKLMQNKLDKRVLTLRDFSCQFLRK